MACILIVCTANICRSPVVEAILRRRLREEGLTDWEVGSAGTWALDGNEAALYSVQILAEHGIDITTHRSRPVKEALLAKADLVLCMESGHAVAISSEFPAYAGKIFLLSEMVGQRYSIADPYGGPLTAYRHMVSEVTELIEKGLAQIVTLAQAHADSRNDLAEDDRHATSPQ